ncbi:hypothetical protein RclHR1_34090002 [Rhizophagus clarus]|uniref:Uncharacterized protein n=1 Tax=Rhizophagus clarus TaxID=94130 RepID=A0A2Z6R9M2_9GLOM|nr:hypothetical protein RclHR1_34090002 [Rhizophagus clarus]GES78078.1 hypothetical protein GLOIN_2v1762039 [Rhizophagus clarus]
MLKKEKELYSKVCAASSIKFVAGEVSDKTTKPTETDKFSSSLATILTRDREVVAVMLKILTNGCNVYIAKNDNWLENDIVRINRIENCLKRISEDAPIVMQAATKRDDVHALSNEIMMYCAVKLKSRIEKLKIDIISDHNNKYCILDLL